MCFALLSATFRKCKSILPSFLAFTAWDEINILSRDIIFDVGHYFWPTVFLTGQFQPTNFKYFELYTE